MTAATITNLPAAGVAPLPAPVVIMPRGSVLADPERARMNMKAAEFFAQSDLIPTHYRGKPANCFIAINRAQRLGVDEMYFMEKTFIVGGKLGIAAELAIELANSSGRFRGPMRFKLSGDGDERACTASAVLADGTTVENTVTYAMAKADGWTKNSKWQSLRDQMLQYRAGVFLARLYAGGAMGGMSTREELEDVAAAHARDITPVSESPKPAVMPPQKSQQAAPKPPIEINLPHGWEPARFDRTKRGLKEALEFLAAAVLDGSPIVVGMNNPLLDMIAEKLPELADEVSGLRSAAAEAMAGPDTPDPLDPEELDEFGLPPLKPERLPEDPPE